MSFLINQYIFGADLTQLGVILDDSFDRGSIGSDYTLVGSPTISMDGTDLNLSGGDTTYGKRLNWNKYSQILNKYKITITYQQVDNTATSYGPAIGTKTLNQNDATRRSMLGLFNTSNAGNEGKLQILSGNNGSESVTGQAINGSPTTVIAGDEMVVTFERNGNLYTANANNITQGIPVTLPWTAIPPTGPGASINNMGNFAIWLVGGSQKVHSFKIESTAYKNPEYAFIGDSITSGFYVTNYNQKFADQIATAKGKTHEIFAGPSDYVLLYNTTRARDFFNLFRPGKFFLMIGGNDLVFGTSLASTQTNYSGLVTYLKTLGSEVVHFLATPRNSIDFTTWNAWITSTFGGTDLVIDVFTPLLGAGTGLNAAYDSGDGTHPNQAGMDLIASTAIAAL